MYHYTECGLSNIYLLNGFVVECVDGEEYTSIDDMGGLHKAIAQIIADNSRPLSCDEFKFLRVALNVSQKTLGHRFGVNEQTVARYEKGQTQIPWPTDAALRSLYMEMQEQNNPVGYFLELIADAEACEASKDIHLQEVNDHWALTG
mgnify:CR=1 FL=1